VKSERDARLDNLCDWLTDHKGEPGGFSQAARDVREIRAELARVREAAGPLVDLLREPPKDAPLPWGRERYDQRQILGANGFYLGEFRDAEWAAYAVAAANALPGLVGACTKAETIIKALHRDLLVLGVIEVDDPPGRATLDSIRAALAALPQPPPDPDARHGEEIRRVVRGEGGGGWR
jgi:hypothetical protein